MSSMQILTPPQQLPLANLIQDGIHAVQLPVGRRVVSNCMVQQECVACRWYRHWLYQASRPSGLTDRKDQAISQALSLNVRDMENDIKDNKDDTMDDINDDQAPWHEVCMIAVSAALVCIP